MFEENQQFPSTVDSTIVRPGGTQGRIYRRSYERSFQVLSKEFQGLSCIYLRSSYRSHKKTLISDFSRFKMIANIELYSQFHAIPTRDLNKLLSRVLPEMEFGEEDVIMDVGCGPGDNTRDVLLPRILKLKKLIAMDISPQMIEYAQKNMADPMIEYCVADIEDKSSLKQWEGSISKIFSTHCLNWTINQKKAFECLNFLLQSKGEAGLTFVLSTEFWDAYPALINHPKWNKYLKEVETHVPSSHHLNLRSEYFRKLFTQLGFEVLQCQDDERTLLFRSDTEYRDTLGAISPLPPCIPEEFRAEFMEDFLNGVFKVCPRNCEGLAVLSAVVLTVHLRKP